MELEEIILASFRESFERKVATLPPPPPGYYYAPGEIKGITQEGDKFVIDATIELTPVVTLKPDTLAALVESIAGADPLQRDRSRPVVDARTLLASALLAQGITEPAAGKMLGYNASTIHHYRELMRDAEKGYNPALLTKWNELKSILDI